MAEESKLKAQHTKAQPHGRAGQLTETQAAKRLEELKRQKGGSQLPVVSEGSEGEIAKADWESTVDRALEMEREQERPRLAEDARLETAAQETLQQFLEIAQTLNQGKASSAHPVPEAAPTPRSVSSGSNKKSRLVQTTADSRLTLPLQFDWARESLIGSNKIASPALPPKFAGVLRGWFEKESSRKIKSHRALSYLEVATVYLRGKYITIPNKDFQTRLENRGVSKNPAPTAHQFARDFRRWLKSMGIAPTALFRCDRGSKTYGLVSSGWHQKTPVVYHSEPRMEGLSYPDSVSDNDSLDEESEDAED